MRGTSYAWSLSRGYVMHENEEDENVLDPSHGKCVLHGGGHEKKAVICVRVYFDSSPRFEQTLGWSSLDENESGCADVKKDPLLKR